VKKRPGHNEMLAELPKLATLVIFSVQADEQLHHALRSIQCEPRVVAIPVVAGSLPGPLSPAQLRSIAPAFALMGAKDLPEVGNFVLSCSSCASRHHNTSKFAAFLEISAAVRSKTVGQYNAATTVVAARVDLSKFVAKALESTSHCGTSCSISLVITHGVQQSHVLATTAVLPPNAPSAPTIFDIEGTVFMRQAWPSILAQPSGKINISGVYVVDSLLQNQYSRAAQALAE
jgi:hypothetical protein